MHSTSVSVWCTQCSEHPAAACESATSQAIVKEKALDRMFFEFLLMNHGKVSAKSARCSPFRPSPEPPDMPQVTPQDPSAEMLPPWENVPQGWSQQLPNGDGLKQFDPDNVMPVPEMIDPNNGTANPASWLVQGAPKLPEFQVPKLFTFDHRKGNTIMCVVGVVGKDAGSSVATFNTDSESVGLFQTAEKSPCYSFPCSDLMHCFYTNPA